VSFYRPSAHPDDLLLALARGGHILIKGFLASPSGGIEQVVFDHDAAWQRADLEQLARVAPLLDDRLVFRPELSAETSPSLSEADAPRSTFAAAHHVELVPEWNDAVTGLDPHAAVISPGEPSPGIDLHALF
jgi:hypothetical protein